MWRCAEQLCSIWAGFTCHCRQKLHCSVTPQPTTYQKWTGVCICEPQTHSRGISLTVFLASVKSEHTLASFVLKTAGFSRGTEEQQVVSHLFVSQLVWFLWLLRWAKSSLCLQEGPLPAPLRAPERDVQGANVRSWAGCGSVQPERKRKQVSGSFILGVSAGGVGWDNQFSSVLVVKKWQEVKIYQCESFSLNCVHLHSRS